MPSMIVAFSFYNNSEILGLFTLFNLSLHSNLLLVIKKHQVKIKNYETKFKIAIIGAGWFGCHITK